MKTSAIFLLGAALSAGCSSAPAASPPNEASAGSAAVGSGGQASSAAGASGSASAAGGTAASGAGGTNGTPSGGASDSSGATGASGTPGSAGASGSAAVVAGGASSAGAGGSAPVDPGNLPNQIPAGYTGTPFGGTPQVIPGKIEVERYDLGGVNVAFNAMTGAAFNACGFMRTDAVALECTGQPGPQDQDLATCANYPAGSVYIGYIGGGNWYKYTVDVVEAGTYVISGHEGVAPNNTAVQFGFTAAIKTANVTLPSTANKCTSEAYHVWGVQDNLAQIDLVPGRYVLTLTVVNAGLNMDWFAFTKQ